jgi:hypothetical protein
MWHNIYQAFGCCTLNALIRRVVCGTHIPQR